MAKLTARVLWRDGLAKAIAVIEHERASIMRRAMRHHDDGDYDLYEELESQAALLDYIAKRAARCRFPAGLSALKEQETGE